ncbi:MAG: hypothetical protein J7621_18345 [Niastella sp.]|nr:hypothetical protein [Niastella sp.]PZR19669.1 MAG: hypothetical protein DI539_13290 [Flavobacterium psychrophilum]
MYTQVWAKYLPIIKILLKKSITDNQDLTLNRIDFEKLGIARKAGYKFTILFEEGKAANTIGSSQLARDLATVLLENNDTKYLFKHNTYEVTLTPKFVLQIVNKTKNPVPLPSAEPETEQTEEE